MDLNQIKIIPQSFYLRDTLSVAHELIGKILVRSFGGRELRFRITETEAYCGEKDTACHAHKGKTPRNAVMYRTGGCTYIYLCYGIHYLLNIVTREKDNPEAVLLRGGDFLGYTGGAGENDNEIIISGKSFNGPGKLTKAAKIDISLNGTDVTKAGSLWIEDDGYQTNVTQTKRIGIDYATAEYRDKLWRFIKS